MADADGAPRKKTRRVARRFKVPKGSGKSPPKPAADGAPAGKRSRARRTVKAAGSTPEPAPPPEPASPPEPAAPPVPAGDREDSADDTVESREKKLHEDYLEFAHRYEEQMLYDEAIKYFRKAGAIQDIARVKEKMQDLYLDKARDFESQKRYFEAAMLYRKMGDQLEAERLTAMARDHGEFTMDDVGKFDLAGDRPGGGGDGGPDETAMFIDASTGETIEARVGGSDGADGGHGGFAGVPPAPPAPAGPPGGGQHQVPVRDVTGSGSTPPVGGEHLVEVERGDVEPGSVGDGAKKHLSFCPYCGEKIALPKAPSFCPYCGDRF